MEKDADSRQLSEAKASWPERFAGLVRSLARKALSAKKQIQTATAPESRPLALQRAAASIAELAKEIDSSDKTATLWIEKAKKEIEEAEKSAILFAKSGKPGPNLKEIDDFIVSEGRGALYSAMPEAAGMAGFKHAWRNAERTEAFSADPRPDAGELSIEEPVGDIALTVLNAKIARRFCDLARGTWPKIKSSDKQWKMAAQLADFATPPGTWPLDRKQAQEPTLGTLIECFGDAAREAAAAQNWGKEALSLLKESERSRAKWEAELDARIGALRFVPELRAGAPRAASARRSFWNRAANSNWEKASAGLNELDKANPTLASSVRQAISQAKENSDELDWKREGDAKELFGAEWAANGELAGDCEIPNGAQKAAWRACVFLAAERLCSMALGRWPPSPGDEPVDTIDARRFATADASWIPGEGSSRLFRSDFEKESTSGEPPERAEPSLPFICSIFGKSAIEALRSSPWAEEASGRFSSIWRSNSGISLYGKQPEWAMAQKTQTGPLAEAAIACGVPPYALGIEPVPPGRWMQESVTKRLLSCPDPLWGEFEPLRQEWTLASAKERQNIDEMSLSASYSDDPSCRDAESRYCAKQEAALSAQEAILDILARSHLGKDDPYRAQLQGGCDKNIAEIDIADAPSLSKTGLGPLYLRLAAQLGASQEWPLHSAKDMAEMIPALVEARQISESIGSDSMGSNAGEKTSGPKARRL